MTSAEKTEKQTVSAAGAANPYFKIKSGLFRCPPFFKKYLNPHCVKIVQIRSFFWSVFSRIRTEYGTEKALYLETFHAVSCKDYDSASNWHVEGWH